MSHNILILTQWEGCLHYFCMDQSLINKKRCLYFYMVQFYLPQQGSSRLENKDPSFYLSRTGPNFQTEWLIIWYTHGDKKLHILLVKYFNDFLDEQKSQRSIDKVTYFYLGDLFCIHHGTKYANFQEKIFADISGRKLQTLCIT